LAGWAGRQTHRGVSAIAFGGRVRSLRAANDGSAPQLVLRFRNFVTPREPNFQLRGRRFLTVETPKKRNAQIGDRALLFKPLHS